MRGGCGRAARRNACAAARRAYVASSRLFGRPPAARRRIKTAGRAARGPAPSRSGVRARRPKRRRAITRQYAPRGCGARLPATRVGGGDAKRLQLRHHVHVRAALAQMKQSGATVLRVVLGGAAVASTRGVLGACTRVRARSMDGVTVARPLREVARDLEGARNADEQVQAHHGHERTAPPERRTGDAEGAQSETGSAGRVHVLQSGRFLARIQRIPRWPEVLGCPQAGGLQPWAAGPSRRRKLAGIDRAAPPRHARG